MYAEGLISVRDFCGYYQLEMTFVQLLEEQGLIQTVTVERTLYLEQEQLPRLEKLVRLHQDLSIHPDDLDVVSELLDRIEGLQNEVTQLQNRLAFYEPRNA